MTKHTPGPWTYRETVPRHFTIVGKPKPGNAASSVQEVYIAQTVTGNKGPTGAEDEANARLIAAAPETAAERDRLREIKAELLFHLKDVMRLLANSTDPKEDVAIADNLEECIRGRLPSIRAAIARAEGEDR